MVKTLYVGNIPWATTEEELQNILRSLVKWLAVG